MYFFGNVYVFLLLCIFRSGCSVSQFLSIKQSIII